LWACVAGILHFRFMLEGRQFTILTDHKPLTFALSRTSEPWTARQSRHLSYIAKFRHIAGIENVVADTLSRPATVGPAEAGKGSTKVKAPSGSLVPPATAGPPKLASVARAVDKVLDYHRPPGFLPGTQKTLASSSLDIKAVDFSGVSVLCDMSRGLPLVGDSHRQQDSGVLGHSLHRSPGYQGLEAVAVPLHGVARMASDIASWCRDCQ
jgi:hypothetical protein